jgi:hypothetical protein
MLWMITRLSVIGAVTVGLLRHKSVREQIYFVCRVVPNLQKLCSMVISNVFHIKAILLKMESHPYLVGQKYYQVKEYVIIPIA